MCEGRDISDDISDDEVKNNVGGQPYFVKHYLTRLDIPESGSLQDDLNRRAIEAAK